MLFRSLQFLLCVQRQLDHALEELICRQAGEILEDELFDVEAHEVAELQGAVAGGEHEIAVAAVDHDDVALGVEAAAPEFAGGALEGVAGKAAGVVDGGADRALEAVGDCQKFCVLSPVDLTIDLEPIAEHHGKLRLCRTPFASRHLPLLGDLAQL